jgi:sulfur relay (sulfurtransferase) DsrC/TusE family protein
MLATWLVEFYLSKCNELDDLIASSSASNDVSNLQAEQLHLEEELQEFFETYKVCMLSSLFVKQLMPSLV